MYKTILVPTDGTALSDKAISAAVEYAKKHPGCRLIGLSVAEPLPLFQVEMLARSIASDQGPQIKKGAQARVARVTELASAAGVPCETVVTDSARPHEEIIRISKEYDCDCIIMASHGRKGLNKFFIGSETQKVLAIANIPVLVYR